MAIVPIEDLRFFAQHGEDSLFWEFFDFHDRGTYIDVGAFDGIYLSNTYSFYQQGWRGLCVEPHPHYFKILAENRPDDVCVQAVCGSDDDIEVEFRAELVGLYSTASGASGLEEAIAKRYEKNQIPFEGVTSSRVPMASLSRLTESYLDTPIDLISIDVEGLELQVLAGLGCVRPRVFLIEENDAATSRGVSEHLSGLGYILARKLGVNAIYTRTPEDARRIREIQIRCAIEKVLHPLGPDFTWPEYRRGHIIDEAASLNERELHECRRTEQRLQRRIQRLTERASEYHRSLELLRANLQKLQSQIDERDALCRELTQKMQQVERTLHNVSQRRTDVERRVHILTRRLREAAEELERAKLQISEMMSAYRLGTFVRHPLRTLSALVRDTNRPDA